MISIILRRPPYGDINAAEAVRHAMGAVSDDIKVSLIMYDSGVLTAKKGQDMTGSGFTSLGDALKDCVEMGIEVYAEKASLMSERLREEDIIEGVRVSDGAALAEIIKESSKTLIF